ncbi:hypothetical protein E2C01_017433 [Portunus trituberculatus]|uniref:Uncharacterized protein n=1 Tax=Portunus trituberculatus TaxID=210409 RepID=A0A5B7DTP2_PORTR|nr:hypothetical protein [Portunus trituberculatus]
MVHSRTACVRAIRMISEIISETLNLYRN